MAASSRVISLPVGSAEPFRNSARLPGNTSWRTSCCCAWGGNDPPDPDYVGMYDSIMDSLISETDRLAQNSSLRRFIDFRGVRDTLAAVQPGTDRTAAQTSALRAVLAARFVEWTMQKNR